ncbi:hypothetical protein J6590_061633 [Homalodisca vitripennis]|nr:hypothetical protein J6590_061631 [Homalodisca vitripennis]KAG8281298.1 hypothetical protein J6590_061633 [Homalodisca vitripennis]
MVLYSTFPTLTEDPDVAGDALKCHSCTSMTDPKCGDPIDSSVGLTECTPDFMKDATKLLQGAADAISGLAGKLGIDTNLDVPDANAAFACVKAVRQEGDKKAVIRGCSVPSNSNFDMCAKLKAQGGGVVTFCETCTSDGCNGASGVSPNSLLALLVVAVTALLVRL